MEKKITVTKGIQTQQFIELREDDSGAFWSIYSGLKNLSVAQGCMKYSQSHHLGSSETPKLQMLEAYGGISLTASSHHYLEHN